MVARVKKKRLPGRRQDRKEAGYRFFCFLGFFKGSKNDTKGTLAPRSNITKRVAGRSKREGMYVYIWLIHLTSWLSYLYAETNTTSKSNYTPPTHTKNTDSKWWCCDGGCACAQLLSSVRLCETPRTASRQAPLSMEILQSRILECVTLPSSRGSSQPRDWTQTSHTAGRFLYRLSHQGSPMVDTCHYGSMWILLRSIWCTAHKY